MRRRKISEELSQWVQIDPEVVVAQQEAVSRGSVSEKGLA
jgi:hypothetical protein